MGWVDNRRYESAIARTTGRRTWLFRHWTNPSSSHVIPSLWNRTALTRVSKSPFNQGRRHGAGQTFCKARLERKRRKSEEHRRKRWVVESQSGTGWGCMSAAMGGIGGGTFSIHTNNMVCKVQYIRWSALYRLRTIFVRFHRLRVLWDSC